MDAERLRRRARLLGRRFLGPALATRPWCLALARVHRGPVPLPVAVRTLAEVSREAGVPPLLTVSVALAETGLRGDGDPPSEGWFQFYVDRPPYPVSATVPTRAQARDLRWSAAEFCRAATYCADQRTSLPRDIWRWAAVTQGVAGALDRAISYRRENFMPYLYEASGLLRAFDTRTDRQSAERRAEPPGSPGQLPAA